MLKQYAFLVIADNRSGDRQTERERERELKQTEREREREREGETAIKGVSKHLEIHVLGAYLCNSRVRASNANICRAYYRVYIAVYRLISAIP